MSGQFVNKYGNLQVKIKVYSYAALRSISSTDFRSQPIFHIFISPMAFSAIFGMGIGNADDMGIGDADDYMTIHPQLEVIVNN